MTRRLLVLAGLILAGALTAAPRGQTAQRPAENSAPSGLLMGTIVDPLDGQPVANAQVTLGGAPPSVRNAIVLSDSQGRFVFMDLPKGLYTINATKPGYSEGAYGRRRPMGLTQSIALAEAERIANLSIPIWKHAAITGRVVDEAGEPMVAIGVSVLQRTVVAGNRKLKPVVTVRTDDRGVYRASFLTPGDYVVVVASTQASAPEPVVDLYRQRLAAPARAGAADTLRDLSFSGLSTALNIFERHGTRLGTMTFLSTGGGVRAGVAPSRTADGRLHVYPTQCYPAASTPAEATTITVRSGEERSAVDVQLKLVATAQVSGTVTGPDGPAMVALWLTPDTNEFATEIGFETATTVSDSTGRFTFLGVPLGRYQLRASWVQVPPIPGASRGAPPPLPAGEAPRPTPLPTLGGTTLWAAQTVTVGANDVNDLAITVRPGFRISGRAEFTGAGPLPSPDAIRRMTATLELADAQPLIATTIGRGQFDEAGRLSTYQLPLGRYYLRINNPPPGWTLKSARVDGRDVSNVALTLDRDVAGVVISFTDRPSSLSGQVSTASGQIDSSATVLVFPADSATWTDTGDFPRRLRAMRVDRDGRYSTVALPAGDYMVVAVADEESANWQDPSTLQMLARVSSPITIADGESRSVPLKTMAVRR